MEIVINKCYGGFSVSEMVYEELDIEWDGYGYLSNKDLGINSDNYLEYRTSEKLVEAVKKLGDKANGSLAELLIVAIPDDIEWSMDDYDGVETIHENHRSW